MATSYRPMATNNVEEPDLADFASWDSHRLGLYFRRHGLGEYQEMIVKHKITGQLAPLLQDDDLKEMGITVVGDRLQFRRSLKELSRRERFHKRIQSLWDGEERLFFSTCEQNCWTLGGLCRWFEMGRGSSC